MRFPRRSPRRGSRWSAQSSDWVIVNDFETSSHTESRSPQRNDDNMSSKQVANASANGSPSEHSHLAFSDNTTYYHSPSPSLTTTTAVPAAATTTVAHVPPSNPGSSSTDTAGTDDTLPAHHPALAATATTTTLYPAPAPTHPQLTHSNMEAYQQALNEYHYAHPGSVTAWADRAGMGTRLLDAPYAGGVPYYYTVNAMVAAGRRGGGAVAADWCVVPQPTVADEDVAATGAWCGDGGVGGVVRQFEGFGFEGGEGGW